MSDAQRDEQRRRDASLAEMIDLAGRRIMAGLVVAGGAIALGLYAQPGPARYQIVATDAGIARVNTRNGSVITCEGGRCFRTLRPSQDFESAAKQAQAEAEDARRRLSAPPPAQQQPAQQAPAAQPAPASR